MPFIIDNSATGAIFNDRSLFVGPPKSGLLADHAINIFTDKYSANHFHWQQGYSILVPDPFKKKLPTHNVANANDF